MPELPDIVIYIEALEQRILNQTLERVHIRAPFLLRTAVPPLATVEGRKVIKLRRIGKRIGFRLEDDLWLVLHLMIAGRLHWREIVGARGVNPTLKRATGRAPKNQLATFSFTNGTLSLTEAGTQRRASLHLVQSEASLEHFNPGGLEIFDTDLEGFATRLQSANHTLKRALTDPRLFSGIGNAYSDEIIWEAQLSPIALTQKLNAEEVARLFTSTRATLAKWIDLLRAELVTQTVSLRPGEYRTGSSSDRVSSLSKVQGPKSRAQDGMSQGEEGRLAPATIRTGNSSDRVSQSSKVQRPKSKVQTGMSQAEVGLARAPVGPIGRFPEKVTAFRPEMAVHGKYQQPCPRCGAKVQRIRYASNETNYCPNCQRGGKLLADRALSRLLRSDWPRTPEELEGLKL